MSQESYQIDSSLGSISGVLFFLKNQKEIIQFDFNEDQICYIGKIEKILLKTTKIRLLNPKGVWEDEEAYLTDRIRTIRFDNDYINSLWVYSKSISKIDEII